MHFSIISDFWPFVWASLVVSGKEPACQSRRHMFNPTGKSPGEGNGNIAQYSCLGNPMVRGAWWATAHGVAKESVTINNKCLLWRNNYLDLLPIFLLGLFFLILSCMCSLYILEINPLSVTSFGNIFSHYVGCLFILFMFFFAVQELLSLIKSHFLLVFLFSSF